MTWNSGHLLKSGQYEVIRMLGSGGFGMTYLAKDLNLERQVVIKRPNLSFEANQDHEKFLRRFKREGQFLAQIKIPNVVRVIDFVEIEGMPCLIMDFIEGDTLDELIRRRGCIPEEEVWILFKKLADALKALHKQEIIHCDIHPGNIIMQPNGEPMLIDFGSTKLLNPTIRTTNTVNDHFTPYEQRAESEDLKPQISWDIYGLAANMYFAVTGQKPLKSISRRIYGDTLQSPQEIKTNLSDQINHLIIKGMELEHKNRPTNIESWVNSLKFIDQEVSTELKRDLIDKRFQSQIKTQAETIETFIPAIATISLILGYFLVGMTTVHSLGIWAWLSSFTWIMFFTYLISSSEAMANILILIGCCSMSWTIALLFSSTAGVGTYLWIWIGSWIAGLTITEHTRAFFWIIFAVGGALLIAGNLGAILSIGFWWGLIYGLLALISFLLVDFGHRNLLKGVYSHSSNFLVHILFLILGLISGGYLGSFLRSISIIKIP
jgi:serine/threonine protein kinase